MKYCIFFIILTLFGCASDDPDPLLDEQSFRDLVAQGGMIDLGGQELTISNKEVRLTAPVTIQNGKLKRGCPRQTVLAAPYIAGSNEITVTDASIFEVGETIAIFFGTAFNQNSGHIGQKGKIMEINGNTITTNQSGPNDCPKGSIVAQHWKMFKPVAPYTFKNLEIDGNRVCHDYTHDWRYNRITTTSTGDKIVQCKFYEFPGECIFHCGGLIDKNIITNGNGSGTHASCSNPGEGGAVITNNYFDGICQVGLDENGHNQGGPFTYSANTQNNIFANNICKNGSTNCVGSQGLDDYDNIITDNIFENFSDTIQISIGHPNPDDVSGNTFINIQ